MDFVERWFGASPDGGDGTFELLLIATGLLLVCAVVATFRRRKARTLGVGQVSQQPPAAL